MTEPKNDLLKFPCEFPIKVMGKASDDFATLITDLVRQHVPDLKADAIKSRLSKDGKYISLTITIKAQSKPQLDAIYQALTANEKVLMAL